jgi:hypothetical protein
MATLRNDDFGITLEYPWQYGYKSGHKLRANGETISTGFIAPGGVNLGTIDVPAGYYTGTDFERAFLSVNIHRKLTSEQCSQFAGSGADDDGGTESGTAVARPALQPAKLEFGNQEYLMLERAAENSKLRNYHTYQSGACYEFVLGVQTNDSDAGDQQIKPVSMKQVFARLEKILATVDIASDPSAIVAESKPEKSEAPPQK